jgi:hypothetical protein
MSFGDRGDAGVELAVVDNGGGGSQSTTKRRGKWRDRTRVGGGCLVQRRCSRMPFIVMGVVSRGGIGGESVASGGAPLICRLLEEEAMRWPFDEGKTNTPNGASFSFSTWRWRSMDRGAHGTVTQVTRRWRLSCARRKETRVELGLLMGGRSKASGPARWKPKKKGFGLQKETGPKTLELFFRLE